MNDNILKNKEISFMTKEERIIYIKLMIDEAKKNNNMSLIAHYTALLDLIEKKKDNELFDFIKNHRKK